MAHAAGAARTAGNPGMLLRSGQRVLPTQFDAQLARARDDSQQIARAAGAGADDRVVKTYVVRRRLDVPAAPLVGPLAHSALVLRTTSGNHFLLQYGVGEGDGADVNATHLQKLTAQEVRSLKSSTKFAVGDGDMLFTFTRQATGQDVAPAHQVHVSEAVAFMKAAMAGKKYHLTSHNCHCAQEIVRAALGLDVHEGSYFGSLLQQILKGGFDPQVRSACVAILCVLFVPPTQS